ncbi:protein kinase domain-containing protein [Rhodococcus koreensis]
MTDVDPFATQRAVDPKVTEELDAAGFEDPQEIGRGGFGVVYRCVQPSLDRTVAVKVLTADLGEENRARFFREQRAMGRLTGHPNIVGVLDVGTTDSGRPYLVMPYHRQDSLDAQIRRHGPLSLPEVLRVGVKMAGALETAHRLGVLHRDVKPANILLTDFGEPALADFGIAHVAGGFETGTGTVTGSPAFTAPEVLSGDPPSPASDIYGLGATVFCAVTGHAAFERRSGEQVVAQFLRITTQPIPDLREHGIAEDISELIARAMAAEPGDRPATAALFGDGLRALERAHGFPVDEMALPTEAGAAPRDRDPARACPRAAGTTTGGRPALSALPAVRTPAGNLPLELTSFVGRRRELSEAKETLSTSRLLTLTGIGGVGKTRLALRVAADVRRGFADGVRLVELAELRDESLLLDVVAAALGVRDRSARPLEDVVAEFLAARHLLLVVDNCEQVVDAVAALVEMLLHTCPELRVVATSREPLGIGGEAVLRVPPLTVPDPDHPPSLRALPRYEAVTLFAERAAAAVPGFEVTDDSAVTVSRICRRLDGLPLPIELAAARLRAMSPAQILQRLTDRYALLTVGSRGAPTRQQTLRLCIDWSYELCTPREQQLWARLSVFAGSFELDAAEEICGADVSPDEVLDVVASLVDKSILIREDAGAVVRFRMLETLRDYGRKKVPPAESRSLRRRHRDWYQQLVSQVGAEWISPRQLGWIARLEREQPNLREAMGFAVSEEAEAEAASEASEESEAGLRIASGLFPFWLCRGLLSEGRHWLDRALTRRPGRPTAARIEALYADSVLADVQGDLTAGGVLVAQAQVLAERMIDPVARTRVAQARGMLALFSGDLPLACTDLEDALTVFRARGDLAQQVWILMSLGLAYELWGQTPRAVACHQQVLDLTQAHGESVNRSYSLWAMGVAVLQQGDRGRAAGLLEECLRLTRRVDEPLTAAVALEALAWIADAENRAERAAVLLGAAEALSRSVGSSSVMLKLLVRHEECERRAHRALGERAFAVAKQAGAGLSFADAVAYALDEQPPDATPSAGVTSLTKRERQVADLVAGGLTNKAIAAQLMISPRTAQGHVEHILAKLGFTSRTQIAAWAVEQVRDERA